MLDAQVLGAVMVFRDVTEQRKLQKRLELADRLASLGTMAAGVAHEINNPLAVVVANATFLAEDLSELGRSDPSDAERLDGMAATIADLRSAADRIGRIAADLRAFSVPAVKTDQTEQTDIRQCIEWAMRATAHEFRHRATLTTDIAAVPPVNVDEMRLGQVLINLLVNAAHAIPPGAADRNQVTVAAQTDTSGRAVIEVRDTGAGISSSVIEHIFEPFFTTKPAGQGSGLGLSICHGLIVAMGGEIQVDSTPDKGTVFRVLLPVAMPRAPSTAPPIAQTPPPVRGRVLVIDDEEMILRVLTRILHDQDVHCTASAQEALSLLDSGQEFDLILSDLMMPTMTGMQFYEILLERHPELATRVVFMTGGVITPNVNAFLQSVSNPRLEKPFDGASLVKMVRTRVAEVRARGTGQA
jgi:nitrogen-specific signal transduction histidine kinase/CheY-like chemotaxis protein